MNPTKAVRRELAADTSLTDLLGTNDRFTTFIFRSRQWQVVSDTGLSSVVISQRGPWRNPTYYHSRHYPRILIEVFSDATRGNGNNPTVEDAEDKAYAIFEVVDKHLHRPAGGEFSFDTMRIHSSERLTEFDVSPMLEADHTVRGFVYYGISHD